MSDEVGERAERRLLTSKSHRSSEEPVKSSHVTSRQVKSSQVKSSQVKSSQVKAPIHLKEPSVVWRVVHSVGMRQAKVADLALVVYV